MSNESSATNWIVGCLVAGFLCLLVCAGGAFVFVRWGMQRQRAMVDEMQRAQMEAARERDRAQMEMARQAQMTEQASNWNVPDGWTPPPVDAPHDVLLPLQVGAWQRTSQTTAPAIPVVNIDREARSAVYAASGRTLDVSVCRVADDEREALFQQAQSAIAGNADTSAGEEGTDEGTLLQTFFYESRAGQGTGWLIWDAGWLFFVHADDSQTPLSDFMAAYFAAIDANHPSDDAPRSIPATENADTLTPDSSTPRLPPPPPPARRLRE
jgi:hypothetical protein